MRYFIKIMQRICKNEEKLEAYKHKSKVINQLSITS